MFITCLLGVMHFSVKPQCVYALIKILAVLFCLRVICVTNSTRSTITPRLMGITIKHHFVSPPLPLGFHVSYWWDDLIGTPEETPLVVHALSVVVGAGEASSH